ncbi:hypothetical protein HMPREF0663_11996 [Hoylesella oralis ATCC 33269]|uniref:Uncharacterized protein n=1 Tax=Hoylesella oralis ATCC 33269 TaxID=873533 RepID=E7RTC3_9BACT|nr:hypothetical protein HMPREF0663_11996 [Hoylesella oralis ATCC 33269]
MYDNQEFVCVKQQNAANIRNIFYIYAFICTFYCVNKVKKQEAYFYYLM